MKVITRTILMLSIVSLLTDISSEMLYPIMPLYLKSIGFSVLLIGILEGVAEATAGLSKGYFGKLSDNMGRRAIFVRLGYTFSSISKPMMAIFTFPLWIFGARTLDRFGKGLRTGARDAILSDETSPENKGRVFGFHRGMDTFGAFLGPLTALIFLNFYPEHYKLLFFIAFIPAILSVSFTFFIKDKTSTIISEKRKVTFFSFLKYWKESPRIYRKVVTGLLLFTLFNSSDLFLIMKVKYAGFNDSQVIEVYIFYNLIYALFSYPLGRLGDKIGLKPTLIIGLLIFAIVYAGMAFNNNLYVFFVLYLLYGIYAAATEGISKAWLSNISDKKDTATAIGTYSGFNSIFTMFASSIAGLIWFSFGPAAAFLSSAVVTLIVVVYFIILKE